MNLKVYLATKNMSVKEFSELIEYSRAYISTVISGRIRPGKRFAKAIERVTNGEVTIEELNYMPKKGKETAIEPQPQLKPSIIQGITRVQNKLFRRD